MSWSGLQPTVEIILLAEGLSRPVDFWMAAVVRWGRQATYPDHSPLHREQSPKTWTNIWPLGKLLPTPQLSATIPSPCKGEYHLDS